MKLFTPMIFLPDVLVFTKHEKILASLSALCKLSQKFMKLITKHKQSQYHINGNNSGFATQTRKSMLTGTEY